LALEEVIMTIHLTRPRPALTATDPAQQAVALARLAVRYDARADR
jgi:hypothetical protein